MNQSEPKWRHLSATFLSRDFLNDRAPIYVMAAGLLLVIFGFNTDYLGLGNRQGLGPRQMLLVASGAALLVAGFTWDMGRGRKRTVAWARRRLLDRARLAQFAGIVLPLGILIIAIRQFHLENEAFYDAILTLTLGGFVIHYFLPNAFRLPFFLLLSVTGIVVVMGLSAGAWLIGLGLLLLVIANLPLPFALRLTLLLTAGVAMALLRADIFTAPWPGVIWPILGSMFFIRLIIYVHDSKNPEHQFSLSHSLAYFFLLPNVVFPLFPPIDYTSFRRGYASSDRFAIYQKGVTWIGWGVINLLVYRFVNYYFVITSEQVTDVVSLVQFMVTTLLLYLRVVGQAYIILGICALFGFDLPRPFNSIYLASSFTDFWRRANIYWKDFMQKVFFYPLFFALRKRGIAFALVVGTLVNFAIAWFLHAGQWFWLRGVFLTSLPDILFWTLLGIFVAYTVLKETKKRALPAAKQAETTRGLLRLALSVTSFFIALNLLWSMWTSPSLPEWWALLRSIPYDIRAVLTLAGIVLLLFGIFTTALWFEYRAKQALFNRIQPAGDPSSHGYFRTAAVLTTVAGALVLLSSSAFITRTTGPVQTLLLDMRVARLSAADSARLERGYYENLLGVDGFNSELWEVYMKRPTDWPDIRETELTFFTGDFREYALQPSMHSLYHGAAFSTNSAGLRDKAYDVATPADTYRFAWLGGSRTMGSGVSDEETFEWLVEDRLNQEQTDAPFAHYESLNFSVGGYTMLQRLASLDAIWTFSPDVLIYVPHPEVEKRRSFYLIQRMLDSGVPIPFPELEALVVRAGVSAGVTEIEAIDLLEPYGDEMLRWGYDEFVTAAVAHDAIPVWLHYPDLNENRAVSEDLANMERIAAEAGFVTINLDSVYDDYDRSDLIVAEWDFHPNALGMRILADAVYEALLANWDTLVVAR